MDCGLAPPNATRHTMPSHRTLVAALLLANLLVHAGPVWAEASPYTLGASQTVTYDSNLLRLSNGQAVPDGYSRADTVYTTALIAGLDQPIGRQRVYANATLRANRLSKNRIYDNEGYALAGGLDWSTVNRPAGQRRLPAGPGDAVHR
jgi:hypothetical protein